MGTMLSCTRGCYLFLLCLIILIFALIIWFWGRSVSRTLVFCLLFSLSLLVLSVCYNCSLSIEQKLMLVLLFITCILETQRRD